MKFFTFFVCILLFIFAITFSNYNQVIAQISENVNPSFQKSLSEQYSPVFSNQLKSSDLFESKNNNIEALDSLLLIDAGGIPSDIQSYLQAFVPIVNIFDAGVAVPTLSQLNAYDAIIYMNNNHTVDPVTIGDVLADYVDAGGGLVLTEAAMLSPWNLQGRLSTDGYSPFIITPNYGASDSLGTFDPSHPIMAGIDSIYGSLIADAALDTGAILVASWANGTNFVAVKGNVVGITIFVSNPGFWSGDVPLLLANAANYVAGPRMNVSTTAIYDTLIATTSNTQSFTIFNSQTASSTLNYTVTEFPDRPWLSLNPLSGSVLSQEMDTIEVSFDAVSLPPGSFSASIIVAGDDITNPEDTIQVYLEVLDPPVIGVSPTSFSKSLFSGDVALDTLTINNTGAGILEFNIAVENATKNAKFRILNKSENFRKPLNLESNEPTSLGLAPQIYNANINNSNLKTEILKWENDGFGADLQNNQFLNFSLTNPANSSIIGPITQALYAGDMGPDGILYAIDNNTSSLMTLDTSSGSFSTIGTMSITAGHTWTGLTYDPTTSIWYALSVNGAALTLYTVDISTAVTTVVGTQSSTPLAIDLAVDNYGIMYTHDIGADAIFTLDKNTAASTLIGPTGIAANFAQGMDVDPSTNVLYLAAYTGAAELYEVDINTGDAMYIGLIGSGGEMAAFGIGGSYSWLSADPLTGTVGPASSVDIEVTFDANGLTTGNYISNLIITSNDPVNPLISVQADLQVTGFPAIAVNPDTLDYDTLFTIDTDTLSFVVENSGFDVLTVTGMNNTLSEFTILDNTSFTLDPFASQQISVSFNSSTAGFFEDSIIVTSDASNGDAVVYLSGTALYPPTMAVTPDTFDVSLDPDEVYVDSLIISNTGLGALHYNIQIDGVPKNMEFRVYNNSKKIEPHLKSENNTISPSLLSNPELIIRSPKPNRKIKENLKWSGNTFGYDYFGTQMINFDVSNPSNITPVGPTNLGLYCGDIDLFGNFYGVIFNSKELVLVDTTTGAGTVIGTLPVSETFVLGLTYDITTNNWYALATDIAGITSLYHVDNNTASATLIGSHTGITGAYDLAADNSGNLFSVDIVTDQLFSVDKNSGTMTLIGSLGVDVTDVYGFDVDPRTNILYISFLNAGTHELRAIDVTNGLTSLIGTIGNGVDFYLLSLGFAGPTSDWLSTALSSGVVNPGESANITVFVHSTGLDGGDFFGNIIVNSNDPINPVSETGVHMHVNGIPDITVDTTLVAFDTTFTNFPDTAWVGITNSGTDTLHVTNITTSTGEFSVVGATAFSLQIGERWELPVAFNATNTGTFNDFLIIISNAANPAPPIQLTGTVIDPPIVGVIPDSLFFLLVPDTLDSAMMTITNSGASDLHFILEEEFAANKNTISQTIDRSYLNPAFNVDVPKDQTDWRKGIVQTEGTGGPDNFGYFWIDSDEPGGPVFNWIDISATGTVVPGLSDDNYVGPFPIGFTFNFYDNEYSQFYIQSNGVISFNDSYITLSNSQIPLQNGYNNLIAWCWDDLDPVNGSTVYYQNVGNTLVIQFDHYFEYPDGGAWVDAEMILYPNGKIIIQYDYFEPGFDLTGCTVGIENADGTDGLQVVFNAAYLHDNLALEFTKGVPWLSENPESGPIQPGGSTDISVIANTDQMVGGDYFANIVVNSNDPYTPQEFLPVQLTVVGTPLISTNTDSLIFTDSLFVHGLDSLDILVESIGNGVLTVNNITSDNPVFFTNETQFVVPPFSSHALTVYYNPDTTGFESANMTIFSDAQNNLSLDFYAEGGAIAGPQIDVTPMLIDEYVEEGDSLDVQITMTNSAAPGAAALECSARLMMNYPKNVNKLLAAMNAYAVNLNLQALVRFSLINPMDPDTLHFDMGFLTTGDFDGNGVLYTIDDGYDSLFTVDTLTGTKTAIGHILAVGGQLWLGMSWDESSGTMYAMSSDVATTSSIYTLDLTTGVQTLIGSTTTAAGLIDIAIDNSGNMYGFDILSNNIYMIDKTNASVTLVGSTNFTASLSYQGMDFDSQTSTLYMACINATNNQSELRTVDVNTGNATLIGQIGTNYNISAFAIPNRGLGFMELIGSTVFVIDPGVSEDLTLRLRGLPNTLKLDTLLTANIRVSTNDPLNSLLSIPVTLEVGPTGIEDELLPPTSFNISSNYPNPFNPVTNIKFQLPEITDVKLVVYNMVGQKIRTLVDGSKDIGYYNVQWDGKNDTGSQVATGIYIYKFEAGNFVKSQKMILMK